VLGRGCFCIWGASFVCWVFGLLLLILGCLLEGLPLGFWGFSLFLGFPLFLWAS